MCPYRADAGASESFARPAGARPCRNLCAPRALALRRQHRQRIQGTLLRLDERYDPAWTAIAALHLLPHVRVDASVNGWFVSSGASRVILLQVTALLQLIAEALGVLYALYLLKALVREPTKRA